MEDFFISSIDEEGGFLINNQDEFIKRFSEKSTAQASTIFGWGKDVEVLKNKFPQFSSKFYKTGSPRIDLSKPILQDYWVKPKKVPQKPFLLVSSNLNCNYDQPFLQIYKTF